MKQNNLDYTNCYIATGELSKVSHGDYRVAKKQLDHYGIKPIDAAKNQKLYKVADLLELLFIVIERDIKREKQKTSISDADIEELLLSNDSKITVETIKEADWTRGRHLIMIRKDLITMQEAVRKLIPAQDGRRALTVLTNIFKNNLHEYTERIARRHPDLLKEHEQMVDQLYANLEIVVSEYIIERFEDEYSG